jgi:hypothetical protein
VFAESNGDLDEYWRNVKPTIAKSVLRPTTWRCNRTGHPPDGKRAKMGNGTKRGRWAAGTCRVVEKRNAEEDGDSVVGLGFALGLPCRRTSAPTAHPQRSNNTQIPMDCGCFRRRLFQPSKLHTSGRSWNSPWSTLPVHHVISRCVT